MHVFPEYTVLQQTWRKYDILYTCTSIVMYKYNFTRILYGINMNLRLFSETLASTLCFETKLREFIAETHTAITTIHLHRAYIVRIVHGWINTPYTRIDTKLSCRLRGEGD